MRQTVYKSSRILRPLMGISVLAVLLAILLAISIALEPAHAQSTQTEPNSAATFDQTMSPQEILALFEREAKAAYAMNKKACEGLASEEKKICLARARLQYDEDMRYAQKRASQGY